jgi:hypothetical protein
MSYVSHLIKSIAASIIKYGIQISESTLLNMVFKYRVYFTDEDMGVFRT